jgi:phospholipase C
MRTPRCLASLLLLFLAGTVLAGTSQAGSPFDRINHFVIIYLENWSFDGLYGLFPGANGIRSAGAAAVQVDRDGRPYPALPQPLDTRKRPPAPDPRIPAALPNGPFDLAQFVPPTELTGDLIHEFYREQYQIDGGRMDKFVAWSDAGGLVMSYYDATSFPLGRLARQYVLADNFFHAAFGGSFLNHFWLICACTPTWPGAPASVVAQLDSRGILVKDGQVTPDGYAVNTSYTVNTPHPATITDPRLLLPSQTQPTIGDRLSAAGIPWAWYSEGWDAAIAGHPGPQFKFHHQPFAYFARYADGTPGRARHLRDERDFLRDLETSRFPAVSFVKPDGFHNEHPANGAILSGEQHVSALVRAIMRSPFWAETAVIITYDENGGRWDHVPPPRIDRWGPGTRVPTIILSPLAKRHYVDHTLYDTTSILKTLEVRWHLRPLGTRDAAANDLRNAFQ